VSELADFQGKIPKKIKDSVKTYYLASPEKNNHAIILTLALLFHQIILKQSKLLFFFES